MRILFVPLDDRPCTMNFPRQVAAIAGFDIILPPRNFLGRFMNPGNPRAVLTWLGENASGCDCALISLDMLVYGGLVASRNADIEDCKNNARALGDWLLEKKIGNVIIYSSIMRTLPTFSNAAILGEAGNLKSALKRIYPKDEPDNSVIKKNIAIELGKKTSYTDLLEKCLIARKRNHEINMCALEWKKSGLVDTLIFGLDDVVGQGPNLYEKREIEEEVKISSLENCFIHPGTDELAVMAIARIASVKYGRAVKFSLTYSNPAALEKVTLYENTTVPEVLESYFNLLGSESVSDCSDINLFCHISSSGQNETEAQTVLSAGNEKKFAEQIAAAQKHGLNTAVADVAFANGADIKFTKYLLEKSDVANLLGYASWNTAGNTLGTVLAHSVVRFISISHGKRELAAEKNHHKFIFERFVDDFLYQSVVRLKEKISCGLSGVSTLNMTESQREKYSLTIQKELSRRAGKIFSRKYAMSHLIKLPGGGGYEIEIEGPLTVDARLPWPRLFEVELDTDFTLNLR